jgi:hypothetical protein
VRLVRTPREEMDRRHAAADQRRRPAEEDDRGERNVQPILSLGSTEFFRFRGKPYGVPPVPWKAGKELHRVYVQARRYGLLKDEKTADAYFALIARLPAMLWSLTRPVGRFRRLLRRVGLHRNPFRQATEAELVELAGFFLTLRSTSSISLQSTSEAGPRRTATR